MVAFVILQMMMGLNPSVLTAHAAELTSTTSIAAYVKQVEKENKLVGFYETLDCESHFIPDAVGDKGRSFGVAQIFLPAHPEVSREEALNPQWAVDWAAEQFRAGKQRMWTCFRLLGI